MYRAVAAPAVEMLIPAAGPCFGGARGPGAAGIRVLYPVVLPGGRRVLEAEGSAIIGPWRPRGRKC